MVVEDFHWFIRIYTDMMCLLYWSYHNTSKWYLWLLYYIMFAYLL